MGSTEQRGSNNAFYADFGLPLTGDLGDLVFNKIDNASQIIFGQNFGIVIDIEVGPDGYLYVV